MSAKPINHVVRKNNSREFYPQIDGILHDIQNEVILSNNKKKLKKP